MAKIQAKSFMMALCQLGGLGASKGDNIRIAQRAVAQAAAASPKPDLIVLPEIWNSPYAVTSFREYSEPIPEVGSTGAEDASTEGETIRALRDMARSSGCWLIGGEMSLVCKGPTTHDQGPFPRLRRRRTGSSTLARCTTPKVSHQTCIIRQNPAELLLGKLVAKHRKVHLFDINIPGRQVFKGSHTSSAEYR